MNQRGTGILEPAGVAVHAADVRRDAPFVIFVDRRIARHVGDRDDAALMVGVQRLDGAACIVIPDQRIVGIVAMCIN